MIYCIARVEKALHLYKRSNFEEFKKWIIDLDRWQFDVETNVTNSIVENRLRTVQFGEYHNGKTNEDKTQWVIEWDVLTTKQQEWIFALWRNKRIKKYIQNAAFEAQVLLNYNVIIDNVVDTMLNEKILYTGYGAVLDEDGATFFSLESIAGRRAGLELDKSYQLLFGHEIPLTPGHIVYAAQDVMVLDIVDYQQQDELNVHYGWIPEHERTIFNHLPTLENEAVLAFADIMWNGFKVDKELWLKNASEAQPIVDKYKEALEEYLFKDVVLNQRAKELGYINESDVIELKLSSPKQKRDILNFAFPDIPGATQPILKKYLKDNKHLYGTAAYEVISELASGNNQPFLDMLIEHCRDDMIRMGYLVPAGSLRINWGSWQQTLPLLRAVNKSLKSTSEEALNKLGHPIAFALLDYRGAKMLTGTFGPSFLEKLDPDGKVRTRFNQILETGRVSSADPNMQQIPLVEDDDPEVLNKYRHCFIPDDESWVVVDSDYSSQELVVIASLSGDPVWMDALRNGQDLHSICAALVFGQEWKDAALLDCAYYKRKDKCKCSGHKRMRTGVKTISFGLAYGMSEFKLSATLKISVKEAIALMDRYFKTFPKIASKLKALGHFGVKFGYIMTLEPYKRKRWYPVWHNVKEFIEFHVKEIEHNKTLGSIERTAKNTPIQGSSADMMKLALILIRRYINKHNLRDKVKLVMQVHDQATTLAKKEYAEEWKIILTGLMEQAAKVIIPSGLLKAETNITTRWEK